MMHPTGKGLCPLHIDFCSFSILLYCLTQTLIFTSIHSLPPHTHTHTRTQKPNQCVLTDVMRLCCRCSVCSERSFLPNHTGICLILLWDKFKCCRRDMSSSPSILLQTQTHTRPPHTHTENQDKKICSI